MKKRAALLAVYLLLSLVLPGCWDYVELEDMSQIIGMAIDYDNDTQQTTVTIQYPSLKKGKAASPEAAAPSQWNVHSATAKTFFDALTKLQEVVPRKLFFGYIKVIIFGEEAVKYNLMDTIDTFDRTPALRSSAYVVITDGKAENTIKTLRPPMSISASDEISNSIYLGNSGTYFPVTLNDFIQMLAIGGWEATAPHVITMVAKSQKEGPKGGSQGNIRLAEEQTGGQRLAGMAAFKGDKFAGWLDEKESMGFGWITGKKMRSYKVSEPSGGAAVDKVYFRIVESDAKIKVNLDKGQPVIAVHVKAVADVRKYYRDQGAEFMSAEQVRMLENKLADSIRSDIDAALKRGQQELKTDIFGFGFALFRKYPKLWQQEYEAKWADLFPAVPVTVYIDAHVINTGINIRKLLIK